MIHQDTNFRQPNIAGDLAATVAVLSCLVEQIKSYSKSEAAMDFSEWASKGYGKELPDVLTTHFVRIAALSDVSHLFELDVEGTFVETRGSASDNLDDLVDSLRAAGWDAERLVDSLIYIESAHHYGLVCKGAGRVARTSPHDSEEFISYGWLGLRSALRRFEPSRGFRFSTYAMTRIVGTILDGVRDEDPLPKRLVTERNKAMKASQALSEALGRSPTLAELSDEVGDKLVTMLPRLGKAASLEELEGVFNPIDGTDVYADVEAQALTDAVNSALNDLGPKQRVVVGAVFMDGMSIRKAATQAGVKQSEAAAMLDEAKGVLAEKLACWV